MSKKIKLLIEVDEENYQLIKGMADVAGMSFCEILRNGTPYNPTDDLISREAIRKALNAAFDCEDATKYGNKNAEQQSKSYSTLMLYEIADIVEDCCDNAPTISVDMGVDSGDSTVYTRPQGEWYYSIDKGWECNQCHEIVKDMPTCMRKALYNFCPNCGAELRKGGAK